jgi:CheY-like chemotaxis protein
MMSKTVLVVDDDEETRKIYREALEDYGYRVLTASQGAEGVALARRSRPHLILLDVRMPIMDGRRAMEYLKSDPATAGIPIFGISGFPREDARSETPRKMEFDLFLTKPLDLDVVIAAIEETIGPPTPGWGA